ncbi:polysaccharide biosynthesis/export family protein [Allocoleopsis sp.]|uniref:polysaccharide biosynthesis/export family protein n=1 Tax=Allocoleopsis sp. TaxID=3088169 RepID=UPI002FD78511
MFCPIGMTGGGIRRRLKQPRARGTTQSAIASLTLITLFATAVPAPSHAQLPTLPAPRDSQIPQIPDPSSVPVPTAPGDRDSQLPSFSTPPSSPEAPPAPPGSRPSGFSNLPPETPYTLGSGDRVKVDVFDVPEYSGEFPVLVDGTLNLPVIGAVSVRGRTLQQASETISQLYARYVRRPLVTVGLVTPRPVIIAVAGEVNRPGTYTANAGGGGAGAATQFPTVTQVITLAGGITQAAAVGEVKLRRRNVPTTYTINLWALLNQGDISQDVALRDGDALFIPTVADINPSETRVLADASFASKQAQPINIAIVGEIARPGPYEITGGGAGTGGATGAITGTTTGVAAAGGGTAGGPPTITKAIQVAGGITSQADVRSVTIRRPTRSGQSKVINVNLWNILRDGDISQDVILQNGDTITIPTATAIDPAEATALAGASISPNTIVVNVVGEVTRAGAIPVPPNTPLNQAILAAGGFNTRAKKSKVDLIRLNPNGSVSKREVEVDLAQGINEAGNPTLRNNDVVIVRRSTAASVGDTLSTILSPVTNFLGLINLFGF